MHDGLVGGPLGIVGVIGLSFGAGRLMGWSTMQSVAIQRDDSDFCKQLEHMNLRYVWARGERTNNDAAEHIADDQGLAQSPGNQARRRAATNT